MLPLPNTTAMETNITLVIMIGLPGAGKSTLCETIVSAAEKKPELKSFSFIHICYDTFIPLSTQEKFVEAKKTGMEEESESWKGARHDVYSNVDRLIGCLKTDCNDSTVFSLFNVHSSYTGGKPSNIVILLDDNFYYRSMRYEYFQLARKHTVGFSQVFVNVDTDVAIEQNLNRNHKVPTVAICSMSQKLQPPKPIENSWESATFVVSSQEELDLEGLWDMIQKCMLSPILPVENDESGKEEARLICSRSVAHQADLYLRSLVGKMIKEAHTSGSPKGKDFAGRVNAARQNVVSSVRKGSLLFPSNLAEVVDDNNREPFEAFIQAEFHKNL